jgi:hypothetical protein
MCKSKGTSCATSRECLHAQQEASRCAASSMCSSKRGVAAQGLLLLPLREGMLGLRVKGLAFRFRV